MEIVQRTVLTAPQGHDPREIVEVRYYALTNRGRLVDLTPHGNRIPAELLP